MKKTILSVLILGMVLGIGLVLFNLSHFYQGRSFKKPETEGTNESGTVFIKRTEQGFRLIRNGEPYFMKGAAGSSHFKELADMGGNTVRLYDTINVQSRLDEALKYGLAVIVDIPVARYTTNTYNYLDEEDIRVLKENVKELIQKHRNHPALLMWNLGNEVNYPRLHWKDLLRENKTKTRFIKYFNELIDIIKNEDKNHPVSTSKWNIGIERFINFRLFSPGIDIVSFNVFGDTKNINDHIKKYYYLFGEFPFYISELGPDGWWMQEPQFTSWQSPIEPTSEKKAEQINSRYNLVVNNNNCLGTLLFYWGNKYECTHTWFSLFKDEYKSEILREVERLWGKSNNLPKFVGLEYMLVEGKGAADNLIFKPDELKNAELKLIVNGNENIRIKWEIYPDVWFQGWNEEKYYTKKLNPPVPVEGVISAENNTATFIAPGKEGPYRIFAFVYDENGYFATSNTPFYVLNPK